MGLELASLVEGSSGWKRGSWDFWLEREECEVWAGGMRHTGTFATFAVLIICITVGKGISSWRMTRSGSGLPRLSAVRKSSGCRVPFAPGESRMRFSPMSSSTRITATPVVWLGTVLMVEVSMKDSRRLVMRPGPKASEPTAPTIFTAMLTGWGPAVEEGFGRERRAQATALERTA